jgi:radical SAM protein with 4Fe4S-binding SPASM domain
MRLQEARKRLPVLGQLPSSATRKYTPTQDASAATYSPALAVWEFTLACDHRCLHCGPRAGLARPDELTTDEALRLVDDLAEMGVGEVVLIGGEAYLRNDFILVIRRIRERGMTCSMTTGGLGLTKTRAEAMIEAGVESVNVSIDGMEASHDYVRAQVGSWRRAFEAIGHLRAAGCRVATNTQINQRSRHELEELLPRLADAGIWAWQLQITCPHGNAVEHPDLVLQPYMYLELFEVLRRLSDACRERNVTLWPGNNLGYFGPHEHALRKQQKQYSGHFTGCEAGRYTIAIESNGVIKNCPSLSGPANSSGSIRELSLRELWDAPQMAYFRHQTADDLWGFCRDCYYAEVCKAGCTASNEPLLGRPGNNPFCHHRALELHAKGLRERIELVKPATSMAPFAQGLFRVVREHEDEALRKQHGPVATEEPRVSRLVEPTGPGRPLTADEIAAL